MALRYILDTNICIYVAKRRPPEVLTHFERLAPGEAAITVITWGELLFGVERSSRREEATLALDQLRTVLPVLGMPEAVGSHYAQIRSDLQQRGLPIGNNDLWIASIARCLNVVLVTNNTREFHRVHGLAVEDWTTSSA